MKKNNKKFFIEALEQRIMLDGAGASTFIDILEDTAHNKFSLNNESKVNKFVESANKDSDVKLPFINQTRDQKRNELKQIVFIDTQVEDYQQLIKAFDKNTEIHLIQSNENGFDKINQTLKGYKNIDSLHIIGHGSAGQILFGDALLSNDTFNQYSKTLKSIGNNLSPSGDILFYGCNIASNERGLSLISKISEITKADIAASDDITGKGGDWHLEKNIGIIETKNIQVADYEHSLLQNGVTSINSLVEEKPDATDFRSRFNTSQNGVNFPVQQSDSEEDFILVLERENVSGPSVTFSKDVDGGSSTTLNTTNFPVNTYLLFLNDDHSNNNDRVNKIGQVVFEYEIYGIRWDSRGTNNVGSVSSQFAKEGATYPTNNLQADGQGNVPTGKIKVSSHLRGLEGPSNDVGNPTFFANDHTSSTTNNDWVSIGADSKTLRIGTKNGLKGDYIRVFTAANTAPVARNDVGVIVEDGTLTVANGANPTLSGSYDATGEHSGDVLTTNSGSHADTDADNHTLVVSAIRVGGTEGSGTAGTLGQALIGTYGQLTLNANGSYSYVANTAAADALDAGDTANDVFNYTVSDGNGRTDIATITITILGVNDAPVARNDVGVIVEDGTLTVANGANANVSGSYDATGEHTGDVIHTSLAGSKDTDVDGDDTANLVVSAIRVGGTEGSGTAGTVGQALSGTYGQLTLNANGSYSYVANQDAADVLDAGDTATDVFNYTVSDGTATDIATITITILGVNDAPVARNDVGVIVEDGTLTVTDGANANVSGSYDATGEHTGDVIHTSLSGSKDTDVDGDDTANLVVSAVRVGGTEGSGTSGTLGQALTGTYGQLTLNADGSYSYVANQDAADALDAGDTANDVFNYTVSDGTATDIATITITILGADEAPTSTVYKEEKKESKKESKRDIRREKRQERRAERIAVKKFELPESSDKKFNQGLKLVDLVAESNSEDELSLKFKVFNDEGKEVQKYYGIMKDGSELPAWITVDSKTGKASTDIPKDIKLLEFKIIAVDTDNNKKQVTVIIDPEKISQDKDIMKQVKRKNSSNITVNNEGLVELNTTNEDGLTNKTATDAVNQNKSSKDIVNSIEANEEFKVQSESRDFNSDFIFKLENILEPNLDKIKLVLENGSDIPSWILFDEATGKITANPPAGIEAMDIKIIIEDSDGVITVKDLKIDFMKNDNNTLLDIEETEKNFVSLNQQLIIESDNLDNYGEKLINNL